ncbi:MAG: LysR family transcriptional regulator [Myxococcota bacterium]|nr:LysR family transcriptional regulator [Myxococcota bacterium]MEC9440180.1 LysR family transcriptional regulator [Myxococcota bacterium]
MIQDWSWDDVRIFLAVAEEGSFSAAATRLELGQPTVSRRVAMLEESLGYPLFRRGRRGTMITREGERLLDAARQMARWAAEFDAVAAGSESEAIGRVSIAAPPGVAFDILTPMARSIREKHPGLLVEVQSGIGYIDLARGDADLAIRAIEADEPALVTLGSAKSSIVACASKEYAATLPADAGPQDVDWICWAPPFQHLFPYPMLAERVPGFDPVFTSNDYVAQLRACELGLGVMLLSEQERDMPWRTELVTLDLGFSPFRARLYLVCAKAMLPVPRVQAVIRALEEVFGA